MPVLMGSWTLAISGGASYALRIPLQLITPGHVATRFRTESVNRAKVRTVKLTGSDFYEVEGRIDLIDDPDSAMTVLLAGMDGSDLILSDGTNNYTCILVSPAGDSLDLLRDGQALRVFKEYTVTVRLRRKDGGTFTAILT